MKFYGQFDPPVDQFIFERYFQDFEGPGYYIECGAFDGITESSCKFFEESLGWEGCNIEASPKIFNELQKNRPNSNNLNLGLSSEKGEIIFTDVNHPEFDLCTNGSISHGSKHKEILDDMNCTYHQTTINTVNFKDLLLIISPPTISLMVLDVEGHEFEVLKGMAGASNMPQILCIEHGHLGANVLQEKVEPLGYTLDTTSFVNSFYIHKSILPWFGDISARHKSYDLYQVEKEKTATLAARLLESELNFQAIHNSTSWKLTKPLRKLKHLLSKKALTGRSFNKNE